MFSTRALLQTAITPSRQPYTRTVRRGRPNGEDLGCQSRSLHRSAFEVGALGGTRTPTILLTATSRQRVYQFRHERFGDAGLGLEACRINGADLTNPSEGYKPAKALNSTSLAGKSLPARIGPIGCPGRHRVPRPPPRDQGRYRVPGPLRVRRQLPRARRARQHLLDLDRDPVAIDQHDAGGDRQVVGQNLDLVGLGCVQLDDGAAGQTQYLMDRHGGRPEDDREIHRDFIESRHCQTAATWDEDQGTVELAFAPAIITTLWLANA